VSRLLSIRASREDSFGPDEFIFLNIPVELQKRRLGMNHGSYPAAFFEQLKTRFTLPCS
jgi:hypothetical protein